MSISAADLGLDDNAPQHERERSIAERLERLAGHLADLPEESRTHALADFTAHCLEQLGQDIPRHMVDSIRDVCRQLGIPAPAGLTETPPGPSKRIRRGSGTWPPE